MERENEAIRELVMGPHCIFALSPVQHPNERQQKYFIAYAAIFGLLRSESDIDRAFQEMIFKNSSSNLRTVVLGLLYFSLLNPQQHSRVFSHVQLLRNEGMKLYVECVADVTGLSTQLLGEGFSELKEETTHMFPQICQDLARYKLMSEDLVVRLLKTVNTVEPTERNMNYGWKVLEMLQEAIREGDTIRGFGRYVFLKLLKLLPLLFVMADEGLHEFREDCQRMALQLWQLDRGECLRCGTEVLRYFQELLPYVEKLPQLARLMREYKSEYPLTEHLFLSHPWYERERILGVNLPYALTETLHYLQQQRDPVQVDYQLSWLYRQLESSKSFDLIVIDMLRYVLRALEHSDGKLMVLDRLINHCWAKPVLCQCARQALFFDWFVAGSPSDERLWELAQPGLRVLQMVYSTRTNLFERMIEYVLLQHSQPEESPKVKENLKRIMLLADARSLLQLQTILTHPLISLSIKQELGNMLSSKPAAEVEGQPPQPYDPFDRDEGVGTVEEQKEISWVQEEYDLVEAASLNGNVTAIGHEDLEDYLELGVEKEFVEQTGNKLALLLEKPTKDSYQRLVEAVIELVRKSNQRTEAETANMLYSEIVKLTYVVFQSHFQEFWLVDRDTNVLGWLLERLHSQWGCTSLELLFYRRLLRELTKLFRITPYAAAFLMVYRIGHHRAHSRQLLQLITEGISKQSLGRAFKMLIDDPKTLREVATKAQPFNIQIEE